MFKRKKKEPLQDENIFLSDWNRIFDQDFNLKLSFGGDAFVEKKTFEMNNTYQYLMANQNEIILKSLDVLYEHYISKQFPFDAINQQVDSKSELSTMISPKTIVISTINRGSYAFYGIIFTLNEETHDIGMLLYKNEVLEVGLSDVAVLSWIAKKYSK